jgi:hypothetical protein
MLMSMRARGGGSVLASDDYSSSDKEARTASSGINNRESWLSDGIEAKTRRFD